MQCLSKLFLVLAQSLIKNFPMLLYVKRFTKGGMNGSFHRALCTKASISQKSEEMKCLRKLFQLLAKCISSTISSFRRAPCS